jgi:tRNA threonylcarbamoyl adenosine modification protein YeaZ
VATLKLQELIDGAGKKFSDITHSAVNCGPGSFTGLRVGVSLIRTLSYVLHKPVALMNRLEVLAFKNSIPGETVFLGIKAVQNFYYAAGYERLTQSVRETTSPRSLDPQEVADQGNAYTKVLVEDDKNGLDFRTSAWDLVELLAMEKNLRSFFAWTDVKPLYIRASEAEEKLSRGILKPL